MLQAKLFLHLGLFLLLFCTNPTPSNSAVCSIDLGSEWMKVAVVNLKPGQSPISVAINEMSKRKSPALVAFHSGDRLVSEEASGLIARYPNKVFAHIRDFLGRPFKFVQELMNAMYLPYDIVEDHRGAAAIRIDDGVTVYSAEELLAMLLKYGVGLAELNSKASIKDGVIAVPPYFGQAERKGLLQAAQLAGINVLSLINEHSGAALQYGIDKDFSNGSRHVVFYDMGSSSTYAALVYFSAYNTKEFGKTVSVNQFQVKDVRWVPDLGGQTMEQRLMEYFADEFNKQVGNGIDIRKSPKAMAKLKKQVKRTKEILSANTAAPISVESIYDDHDFRSTITREKFEELCGDLWERALSPVKEVLKHSGLNVDDIYAVELIGGATRVPKVQAVLQEFLGRKDLDRHLDADEAIVLGAALHAANLSDGIKLNRKLGMIDGSTYGLVVELEGLGLLPDELNKQLIVPRMKKIPSKIFRSIKHDKDFEVYLSYDTSDPLPPGISSEKFADYHVSGLTETSEKYASRNLSSPIKANLHFSLSRSGVLSLDRADALVEVSEWVEVPVKNLTMENATVSTPNVSLEVETGSQNSSEGVKENLSTEGINNASNTEGPSNTEAVMEKKLKKRTFRVPLKVIDRTSGPGASLSNEHLSEATGGLAALDKKDADRKRTAELKNNLEGYIYATKEKLDATADIEKISTEQERLSFKEKLDEVQEWLYTDGEDAPANEFQERLDSLKSIGGPIFFRLTELSARPAATELARVYMGELPKIISEWEKNKSWIPKERIDEVLGEADKIKKWLEEKEAQQKATPAINAPAFNSEEVYEKVSKLQDKVAAVNRIPKPKPKIDKPPKKETGRAKVEDKEASNSTQKEEKPSQSDSEPTQETENSSQNNVSDIDADPRDEL
ncbi:heat shock 70 kDa protein 17 [Amborella trichopoda]|uniref:Heat shock 70 kDa protein 17 n=1 Tax=Amborella trichopoda TaxID=13333 RepID=W1PJ56_AMBTC|nr:heat shock 70 kDa protein 17 [Amborella trichopoda]ERN07661.1 hypothetical protein AMTR_s00155p00034630 [Amborella trichopoda]|eukprot:XP_006845986.1 heat shock 70 kDa protein 17 [Amborella trichopoda]